MFPVRCSGRNGDVHFTMPLLFVRDFGMSADEDSLAAAFRPHGTAKVPGVPIDVLRSAARRDSDVFEVHELSISGFKNAGAFAPSLSYFTAELPALRALVPDQAGPLALALTEKFLSDGEGVDLAVEPIDPIRTIGSIRVVKPININFTNRPDRSGGLVSPKFAADKISRDRGPVPAAALVGVPDLAKIYEGATLLGLPLGSLINIDSAGGPPPPSIVAKMGQPPTIEMTWNLKLKSLAPFQAKDTTKLDLHAIVGGSPPQTTITCSVSDFELALPPVEVGPKLLTLTFGSLLFSQLPGRPPDLHIEGLKLKFDGVLKLIQKLAEMLQPLLGANMPTIKPTPAGISVAYTMGIPEVAVGAFLMRNISICVGVDVPFSPKPVMVSLGFASRANPFNLSVLMFGGGGYVDVQLWFERPHRIGSVDGIRRHDLREFCDCQGRGARTRRGSFLPVRR